MSRGKVEVFFSLRSEAEEEVTGKLNGAVLQGYLDAMRQMVT